MLICHMNIGLLDITINCQALPTPLQKSGCMHGKRPFNTLEKWEGSVRYSSLTQLTGKITFHLTNVEDETREDVGFSPLSLCTFVAAPTPLPTGSWKGKRIWLAAVVPFTRKECCWRKPGRNRGLAGECKKGDFIYVFIFLTKMCMWKEIIVL